jgi:hypothetical protein
VIGVDKKSAFFVWEITSINFFVGAVSIGCYLSGHSKGKPCIPDKLKLNFVCLISSKLRRTALKRYAELLKERPGIEAVKDIVKWKWER